MRRATSRLLLFDLETTGFSRSRDRIMEFSIYDPINSTSVLDTIVNPMRRVPRRGTSTFSTKNKIEAYTYHTQYRQSRD